MSHFKPIKSQFIISKLPPIKNVPIIHVLDQLEETDNKYNKPYPLWLITIITISSKLVASPVILLNIWWKCARCTKSPSPIHHHTSPMGHPIKHDSFSIMDKESQCVIRTIKEAMFIRTNGPSLNRNLCKYKLPHIWNEVLQDMLALHLQWYPHFPLIPNWLLPHTILGGMCTSYW